MPSKYSLTLTAADHRQNGFVALARWTGLSEAEARARIAAIDAMVSDDSEPDIASADFTFILDLHDPRLDLIDNGKRCLPSQIAMMLAPDQVQQWLADRPDPDSTLCTLIPVLDRFPIPMGGQS